MAAARLREGTAQGCRVVSVASHYCGKLQCAKDVREDDRKKCFGAIRLLYRYKYRSITHSTHYSKTETSR